MPTAASLNGTYFLRMGLHGVSVSAAASTLDNMRCLTTRPRPPCRDLEVAVMLFGSAATAATSAHAGLVRVDAGAAEVWGWTRVRLWGV